MPEFFPALVLLFIGLVIGLIMSLMGASGVMIVVPVLNMTLGYMMSSAIGISLFVDVLASLAIGFNYFMNDCVDLRNAIWVSLGAIIGAQLGAGFSPSFPEWLLSLSYVIWLLSAGVAIWKKGRDRQIIAEKFIKIIRAETSHQRAIFSIFLSFIIGVNAGVFGASSGPLFMLVLIFLLGYPIQKAVGTSTIIMMITALSALTGYWRVGNIDIEAGMIITLGTVISGTFGVRLALRAEDQLISKIIGIIFILMGLFQALSLLLYTIS
jgi:uncharacterized membrane protein YfcA